MSCAAFLYLLALFIIFSHVCYLGMSDILKTWLKAICYTTGFIFCSLSFAQTQGVQYKTTVQHKTYNHHKSHHKNKPVCEVARPVVTLSAGEIFTSHVGQSQTFQPTPGNIYYYSANHSTRNEGIYGGFVGAEFRLHPCWALQLGVSYYQTSAFNAKGVLTQGPDDTSSDDFSYKYNITGRQWLAESKLLFNWYERFHPYASVGLGEAFNRASGYQTTVPPFLTFTPAYADHTTKSFSYAVGTGLDVDFVKHFRLGVGYRFSDLGKVNLGAGHIDTVNIANTLKQSHMYSSEVLAQLTFII